MTRLAPSGFVVLGLLERHGAATPYRLDRLINASIGYFWSFPRSQLYAEAARLTRWGLVEEVREETGRRRRLLSITDTGREALRGWLSEPVTEPTQIHDLGLLRLFFSEVDTQGLEQVTALARQQLAAHQERLARYESLVAPDGLVDGSPQRATLELGLRFERLAVAFWGDVPLAGGEGADFER